MTTEQEASRRIVQQVASSTMMRGVVTPGPLTEAIQAPDLMRLLRLEVTPLTIAFQQTVEGITVSEEQAADLLEWAGSDTLDWDALWESTQAPHNG